MNKRIKELADQASDKARDSTQTPEVLLEKFVEEFSSLIVKECILTIQLQIVRNGKTPENLRSYQHVGDIAEKFGIKLPIDYYGAGYEI